MSSIKRYWLEPRITNAKIEFNWLIERKPPHSKVVNFGCSRGEETFKLMWALGAVEAIGVDNDKEVIREAELNLRETTDDIQESIEAVKYKHTKENDRKWWYSNDVPNCIRRGLTPKFVHGDMTKQTNLTENYFDLAYCSFVINHIEEDKRLSAVEEMVRVVRPGGWVVVSEPQYFPDGRELNIKKLFNEAIIDIIEVYQEEGSNRVTVIGLKSDKL